MQTNRESEHDWLEGVCGFEENKRIANTAPAPVVSTNTAQDIPIIPTNVLSEIFIAFHPNWNFQTNKWYIFNFKFKLSRWT